MKSKLLSALCGIGADGYYNGYRLDDGSKVERRCYNNRIVFVVSGQRVGYKTLMDKGSLVVAKTR